MNEYRVGDNLQILQEIPDNIAALVYIDPPYNTKKTQEIHGITYGDSFDDLSAFLEPRLIALWNKLTSNGSIYVHLDYREVHYIKVRMDTLFGRDKFMNEIIWSYDYGGRSKRYWPRKHDTILWYVKNPKDYIFNYASIDRIPYLAPDYNRNGKDKSLGKTPTDVWWNTIVHTNGKERANYPTQKPLKIIERIIRTSSHENDLVIDAFAGSGTTGIAALNNNRRYLLIDSNPKGKEVFENRIIAR